MTLTKSARIVGLQKALWTTVLLILLYYFCFDFLYFLMEGRHYNKGRLINISPEDATTFAWCMFIYLSLYPFAYILQY